MFDRLVARADVEEHVVLGSALGFLAVHGWIEPGTETIARAAAARTGGSAYVVTQPQARGWHVSSHRIEVERVPRLAAFLDHVEVVVSVHGYHVPGAPDAILVGGGRRDLAADLAERLRARIDEMPVVDDIDRIPRSMRGVDPRNPVNRTRGGGVQLELPPSARIVDASSDGIDGTDGTDGAHGTVASVGASVADRLTVALVEFAAALARSGTP